MDGFRDRMNRGGSERGSYDRYDRSARRSTSYGAPAASSVSTEDIMQVVDDSNAKQLEVIGDFFEDAKDDRYESEKQILSALDDMMAAISEIEKSQAELKEEVLAEETKAAEVAETAPLYDPYETSAEDEAKDEKADEILRAVNSNADLLAQFAEEQLPMLVRGNSSILNQIRETVDEQDEAIQRILEEVRISAANNAQAVPTEAPSTSNAEVMDAAAANNALLNAIRSDIAGIQSEIRTTTDRISANADANNEPLDSEDTFTKREADELFKNIEESVHGECVKVYRNITKLLEEQKSTEPDALKKGLTSVKIFVLINILIGLLNLAVLFANIFGRI